MSKELKIEFNEENGGISSIVYKHDADEMNWVDGNSIWGTVKDFETLCVKKLSNGIYSVMSNQKLTVKVTRTVSDKKLTECYIFKNISDCPVFVKKGELGIYTTFNDSYDAADICMTNRCNTHIWCGGNTSWVNALKMGVSDINLGLVLTKGSLNTYSIERDLDKGSNDRGDFILHPSPFSLEPGEEYIIEWDIFVHSGNDEFEKILQSYDLIIPEAEHYTVFLGEEIKLKINKPVKIVLDGEVLAEKTDNFVYKPAEMKEYIFNLSCGEKETFVKIIAVPPIDELLTKRAEYIMKNQQYHCDGSVLDGAYLIYDCKEHYQYFDNDNPDHNASRERLGMGLLMGEYIKRSGNEKAKKSLEKFRKFVFREFVDVKSGAVYDTVKYSGRIRLYNTSWVVMLLTDLYEIEKDEKYLDDMVTIVKKYYENAGSGFYPNGWFLMETIDVLKKADRENDANELLVLYKNHADQMAKTGTDYPPHEVNYEQTIVTPGATFITQYSLASHDGSYIDDAKKQIEVLERFNGHQPDYHLYETAIRHWDDYWFGKSRIYGDTFPHYWSSLSGLAFLNYYNLSGDEKYKKKAEENIRNCLCLFFPDGSASCAYVYPYKANGKKGEFFDEWANDQDFALYYAAKYMFNDR